MSGFTMAMFLAGLRGISKEIKEAARVDGASEWQLFWYMIFPLLRPITLSAMIILGHISLKIFDLIMTQTGGGPGNATEVPGVYMYEITFKSNKYAEGAAAASVMLLMVAVLIVPYLISNLRAETES
jgi:glucose/mannose transport system permease protein